MSEIKENLKKWIDCNVNDGECRKGAVNDRITFTPDDLYELIDELYEDEVEPKVKDLERQLEKTQRLLDLEKRWTKSTQGVLTTFAEALSKRNSQLAETREDQQKLIQALQWNMSENGCRFDHNGNCQEHCCFEGKYTCYHKETKELIEQLKEKGYGTL